jgi:small GTP-binding protein
MAQTQEEYTFKVVILGDAKVGKTNISDRYVDDTFTTREATVAAAFLTKKVLRPKENIKLQIWDTAGRAKFRKLITIYSNSAHIHLYVYDITNKESFDNLHEWLELGEPTAVKIIVGNKLDLHEQRKVSTLEGETFAQKIGALHIEVSAKDNTLINTLFENAIIARIEQNNAEKGSANLSKARVEPKKTPLGPTALWFSIPAVDSSEAEIAAFEKKLNENWSAHGSAPSGKNLLENLAVFTASLENAPTFLLKNFDPTVQNALINLVSHGAELAAESKNHPTNKVLADKVTHLKAFFKSLFQLNTLTSTTLNKAYHAFQQQDQDGSYFGLYFVRTCFYDKTYNSYAIKSLTGELVYDLMRSLINSEKTPLIESAEHPDLSDSNSSSDSDIPSV